MKITIKQLKEAAEDMNKVMELDPPIDTSVSLEELLAQFDEAVEQVEPDDEFIKETRDIINAVENKSLVVRDMKGDNEGKKKTKQKVRHPSKKLRKVPLNMKNRCTAVFEAFRTEGSMTLERLIEVSDSIYCKWTDKGTNRREQGFHTKRALSLLILVGIVKFDGENYKLVENNGKDS